jgi:hypothetical protein
VKWSFLSDHTRKRRVQGNGQASHHDPETVFGLGRSSPLRASKGPVSYIIYSVFLVHFLSCLENMIDEQKKEVCQDWMLQLYNVTFDTRRMSDFEVVDLHVK